MTVTCCRVVSLCLLCRWRSRGSECIPRYLSRNRACQRSCVGLSVAVPVYDHCLQPVLGVWGALVAPLLRSTRTSLVGVCLLSIMVVYCVVLLSFLTALTVGNQRFGTGTLHVSKSMLRQLEDNLFVSPNAVMFTKQDVRAGTLVFYLRVVALVAAAVVAASYSLHS